MVVMELMVVGNWVRLGYKIVLLVLDFCICVGFEGDL